MSYEPADVVRPDGLSIRRERRSRGWSKRALIHAIGDAHERATGLRETISPNLLEGIEETDEPVPYDVVCRIAAGLDCNPMELIRAPESR